MIWVPYIFLAGAIFVIAAVALKLPRSGYTLFGAALLFGLTGYALQGSPTVPSAPHPPAAKVSKEGALFVTARREFFDPQSLPSRYIVSADAFARRGKFQDAANFAGVAVEENPRDIEAWVALGNSLVEHAEGNLTPAALYAYSRAEGLAPDNGAAGYFLGLAFLRAGRPLETRKLWEEALARAPRDVPWRSTLSDRLTRLDQLMKQAQGAGH